MATEYRPNDDERLLKGKITQEVDWLSKDLHFAGKFRDFEKEISPSQSIKTEVENLHTDAAAAANQRFTPNAPLNLDYVYTKSELILDDEFREDKNDPCFTVSVTEYQEHIQETANEPHSGNSIADEDRVICHSTYSKGITECRVKEEPLEHNNYSDSSFYPHENKQSLLELSDDQQARVSIADNIETCKLCYNIYSKESIETHICQAHYELTYKCEFCPQSFEDERDLTRHTRIHEYNLARNYACGRCDFKCLDMNSLKSHQNTHAIERRPEFACHLCEKRFYRSKGLKDHMKLHTGDTYNCEVCEARFSRKSVLKEHTIRLHDKSSLYNRRYKCKICEKEFANIYLLNKHRAEHAAPWKCCICENKFVGRKTCRDHIVKAHNITDQDAVNEFICEIPTSKEVSMEIEPMQSITDEHSRIDTEVSGVEFMLPKTQIPNAAFECTKTELTLDGEVLDGGNASDNGANVRDNQQPALKVDAEQEAGVSVAETCKLCHNIYPKELMEAHVREEHSAKRYICEFCLQTFKEKTKFTRHIKIHDGNRPRNYVCGQCGVQLLTKSSLDRHMIIHVKDRTKFPCRLCEKVFYREGSLVVHMRLHTGDTHDCERCGTRFPAKRELKRHMLGCGSGKTSSVAKRYKCTLCDGSYSTKYLLSVHSTKHTGLPWKCGICEKEFAEIHRCRRHIIRIHKIADIKAANKFLIKIPTAKDL